MARLTSAGKCQSELLILFTKTKLRIKINSVSQFYPAAFDDSLISFPVRVRVLSELC